MFFIIELITNINKIVNKKKLSTKKKGLKLINPFFHKGQNKQNNLNIDYSINSTKFLYLNIISSISKLLNLIICLAF